MDLGLYKAPGSLQAALRKVAQAVGDLADVKVSNSMKDIDVNLRDRKDWEAANKAVRTVAQDLGHGYFMCNGRSIIVYCPPSSLDDLSMPKRTSRGSGETRHDR